MRARHNYVHVVRVHMSREGASASALFVSPEEEDYRPLIEQARSMGIECEVDVDMAPLTKVDGIMEWLAQFDREQTPEPAHRVRADVEIQVDELTRAQRNQDRMLAQIAERLAELTGIVSTIARGGEPLPEGFSRVTSVDEPPQRAGMIPRDAVPPAKIVHGGITPQIEHGETSQGAATRVLTSQVQGVGGVLPGNMQTQGAASEVFAVGVDGEGKLTTVKTSLPKVGDSLKPPHMRHG